MGQKATFPCLWRIPLYPRKQTSTVYECTPEKSSWRGLTGDLLSQPMSASRRTADAISTNQCGNSACDPFGLTFATLERCHAAACLAEGPTMGKKIAIGFLAATLYAAPLEAEPANPVAPAITKPNNDATLRAPHAPPPAPRRTTPIIESAPTGQPPVR